MNSDPLEFSKKTVISNICVYAIPKYSISIYIDHRHLDNMVSKIGKQDIENRFNLFYKNRDSYLREIFDKNFSQFMDYLEDDNIYNKYFKICTRYPYDHCGRINNICKPTKKYIKYMKHTNEFNMFFQKNRQYVHDKNMYYSFFSKLRDYLGMLLRIFNGEYGSYTTPEYEFEIQYSLYVSRCDSVENVRRIYKFHIDYFKKKETLKKCTKFIFILNKIDQLSTDMNRYIIERFV